MSVVNKYDICMYDVCFTSRLSVRSDCVVQFHHPKIVCQLCERKLSCDYAAGRTGQNMSYDDSVFWCYVDPIDRQESSTQ